MKSNNNKFYIALGIILILALLIVRGKLGDVLDSENSQNNQIINSNTSSSSQYTQIPNKSISSKNAFNFIGQTAIICGPIVDGRYASSSNGQPTFLNFDYPYPNHTFTVVVWGNKRQNFGTAPELKYMSRNVCVEGYVDSYKGKPQIEVSSELMISIN